VEPFGTLAKTRTGDENVFIGTGACMLFQADKKVKAGGK
jgi:hypothetical protein